MRKISTLANVVYLFLTVLFPAIFLLLGVYLLIGNSGTFKGFSLDTDLMDQIWARVLGVVVIVLFFLYFVVLYLRGRQEDCIAFDNPNGEVVIAVHAIEDSIRRLVETFKEIRGATPSVTPVNDGIDVTIKASLWDDSNVHETSEQIQSAVKSHVQGFFGLANVNSIRVFVIGTSSRSGTPPSPTPFEGTEESKEKADNDLAGPNDTVE